MQYTLATIVGLVSLAVANPLASTTGSSPPAQTTIPPAIARDRNFTITATSEADANINGMSLVLPLFGSKVEVELQHIFASSPRPAVGYLIGTSPKDFSDYHAKYFLYTGSAQAEVDADFSTTPAEFYATLANPNLGGNGPWGINPTTLELSHIKQFGDFPIAILACTDSTNKAAPKLRLGTPGEGCVPVKLTATYQP